MHWLCWWGMNKSLVSVLAQSLRAVVERDTCAALSLGILYVLSPTRHDRGMRCYQRCLFFGVSCETPGGQAATSLGRTSNNRHQWQCASVCRHFPQPEAKKAPFDFEAWMAFWALDYQNPACFHVVSILPKKGHCYRLNNLSQLKAVTGCIHVPNWGPDSSEMA